MAGLAKRHFEQLAEAIRDIISDVDEQHKFALRVSAMSKAENPLFDEARFFAACGLEPPCASCSSRKPESECDCRHRCSRCGNWDRDCTCEDTPSLDDVQMRER